MKTLKLDTWIEGYLEYCQQVKRHASGTLRDLRCTFRRVVQAAEKIRPGIPLWKLSLEDYLQWVGREREAGSSVLSINKQLSHLRGLLDYTWRSGRGDRNVLDHFYLQDAQAQVEPRALNLEEARQLISVCGSRNRQERGERLMILMLYGCGLRTSELCGLDVGDVDVERQEVMVRHGKGDRQRRIPVPDGVWTCLLAYLTERGGRRGPLFRTRVKRQRMRGVDVCRVMREAVRKAGLPGKITSKTLRHSFATHLMDQGVDLAVIASLMGHRSPHETGVYLHALPGKRETAVEKLQTSTQQSS